MEKEDKNRKRECHKSHSPEINIARNMNTRRSLLRVADSSTKDSDLASTSPILNTTKVRRRTKLSLGRRTIGESASEEGPAEPSKLGKNPQISKTTKDNSSHPSTSKYSTKCPNCDFPIKRNEECNNCSSRISSDSSLADRLRNLKRYKKAIVRVSDLKDAQITDETFVESVRQLDEAYKSTPCTRSSHSPVQKLGLQPFVSLVRVTPEKMQMNSLPETHLSLEEVNEEDPFADAKDAEVVEDLGEFSQWDYKPPDKSANFIHGSSSKNDNCSGDRVARQPQLRELDKLENANKDRALDFIGFSTADKETEELKKWKSSLKKDYPDSEIWENWFVEESILENYRNPKDSRKDTNDSGTRVSGSMEFTVDTGKQSAAEIYSKANEFSPKRDARIEEPGNPRFSADCDKQSRTRETTDADGLSTFDDVAKAVTAILANSSRPETNRRFSIGGERPTTLSLAGIIRAKSHSVAEMISIGEENRDNVLDSRIKRGFSTPIKIGFSTAGDDSIGASEIASIEKETENDNVFHNELVEHQKSPIRMEFSTISGRTITVSKTPPSNTATHILEESKVMKRVNDGLDNALKSPMIDRISPTSKGWMSSIPTTALVNVETKLVEETKGTKDELLNTIQEKIPDTRNKVGFFTAGGRPIPVSDTALATAEARLLEKTELTDVELLNIEQENILDSRSNRGFSTSGGRTITVSKTTPSNTATHILEESKVMKQVNDGLDNALKSPMKATISPTSKGWMSSIPTTALVKVETKLFEEAKGTKEDSLNTKQEKIPDTRNKCGFSTAGGRPIPVSDAALAKAEARLSEQTELTDGELLNIDQENILNSGDKCGFSTAGGRPIAVSKSALTEAEARLFEKMEETDEELLDMKEESELDSQSKLSFPVASCGPSPVFDTVITKTETGLSEENTGKPKEESVNKKQKKDTRNKCGFSTASGRPLLVSDTALAKAEAKWSQEMETIKDELHDENLDNVKDSKISSDSNEAISKAPVAHSLESTEDSQYNKNNAVDPPNSSSLTDAQFLRGFATAGGRPIGISEAAIINAKRMYSELDNSEPEEIASTIPKKQKKEEIKSEFKISSGFSTAGGVKLEISKDSWLKAKNSYEAIEEPSIEDLGSDRALDFQETETIKSKNAMKTITTAVGSVAAAEKQSCPDAEYFVESLDLEDFMDPVEEPEISKKRKFEDIDEDTPLRGDSSLNKKKGRYVNDLQARKLFDECTDDEEAIETKAKSESELNLISEEVRASAVALLEDEELSNEGPTWEIDALRAKECVSPELGLAASSNRRSDSMRNPLGTLNRTKLEKVNIVGGGSRDSNCSDARSPSAGDTKETNDRAAPAEKREESQEIQVESIPDDLTFDSQFSQDIKHSPILDNFIVEAMKIMESRLAMAYKQDEAIRAKRRTKPQPGDGRLYQLRNANRESRISWRQLTDDLAPSAREISEDSLKRNILTVTANSAVHYRFRCADFYGENKVRRNIEGIKVGDGASLILDEQNCVGAREFERAFLASPNVDPNLVPTGWIKNHYRWIVWKLASIDRSKFGAKCLPRMLTPERVMLELKYRYDREIYRTQWPPLRRILERGKDASARLVLCVSSIVAAECENTPVKGAQTPNSIASNTCKMSVTDGWYSVATSIDAAMMSFIKSGKVKEGTKLMISGAKVVNLDQGCSALEIPESVTLRISSNSARRVKWDTKLDFYHANRRPMSLSLKSVRLNGGAICRIVVAISRVYPILYREKLPDGKFVFRNARCDEEAAIAHEARYQAKMEEIYANARREFQISSMKRKAVGTSEKRSYTQEEAMAYSREMEEELRLKISSKMSECLPSPRDVTPVTKIRIADADTSALVTVWSTDRDTTELFVEGSSIAIYNAFASGLRSSELQITMGRSSFVQRETSQRKAYPERIYTSLTDITAPGFNPVYGEFDTIGIVAFTGPAPHGMKNFETVYLACPRSGDAGASDFLSVLFWLGVSAHGYGKILTVGSLVACSNLEWRKNTWRSITTAYCSERSVFSKNPRQNHLVQAFENLRNEIKEPLAYATARAAEIQEEVAKKSALRTPGAGSPYKPAMSTNRTPGWSPRDMSGAFEAGCSTPRMVSKKMTTKKRLETLDMYGEAPKLPSIVINNSSRNVLSEFRSPIRTPVSKS